MMTNAERTEDAREFRRHPLNEISEELTRTLDRRRINLNLLLNERFHGSTKELARAVERSVPYLQKILRASHREARTIGEGVARDIEAKLQLEYLWLDQEHSNEDAPGGSSSGAAPRGNLLAFNARRRLPVLGDMTRGKMMALEKAINFVPSLSRDVDAYVLRATDDAFYPRLWRDEGIIVEPNARPAPESMVVLKRRQKDAIELFKLIAESTDAIFVASVLCPDPVKARAKEEEILIADCEYIHATAGIVDCRRMHTLPGSYRNP